MGIVIVWLVAIIGIVIMQKIKPQDSIYPIYALIVAMIYTVFIFLV